MILWDSHPIVRPRTQVSQSSSWRLQDGHLPFRTTGHCKYRFWSCLTFLRDPVVICVAMEIGKTDPSPRSRLVSCFQHGRTFVAPPSWWRHMIPTHFLIGWNLWWPSCIWRAIESIALQTIAYCLSRLLIGYRSFKRPILLFTPSIHSFTPSLAVRHLETRGNSHVKRQGMLVRQVEFNS